LKGSSATSAPATTAPPASARRSASASRPASPPSPTAEGGYPLTGVSDLPDPDFHAFRQDLADVALAGRVISSHYAEPVARSLIGSTPFYRLPGADSETIGELAAGDEFWMLDDTRGWAWGYGGPERRVGYVRAELLAI
jgi:hypothetical protein